jgi:hypothetical protein
MKLRKILFAAILLIYLASLVSAQKTKPTPPPGEEKTQQTPKTRQVYRVEKQEQIFSVLEGKWDWEYLENSCRENPFSINFSENRKKLFLTYENAKNSEGKTEKKVYTYNLLAISLFGVRGQIEGETRLTEDQKPVVWEFILLSKDEFCWHRTDSPIGSCTKKIVRCK